MRPDMIRNGIDAVDITAGVFTLLGALFTVITAAVCSSIGPDADLVLRIMLGLGLGVLALGLSLAAVSIRKRRIIRDVVAMGNYVTAPVTAIRRDDAVQINGMHPYYLECRCMDPDTGLLHVFRSRNLLYDPSGMLGKSVRIYMDPANMEHYWVDPDAHASGPDHARS